MAIIISGWADFITAVGTSGAEVEFPKNLVKTSDTEVDPNKLYVDSSGTVQPYVQASDLANLYENTFVLDANDYAPEGLTSTITISCASINGFGGKIINLSSHPNISQISMVNITTATNLNGIAFLNCSVGNKNTAFISTWNGTRGTASNCIFTGRVDGTAAECCFYRIVNMYTRGCAFNIQRYNYGQIFYHYDSYYGFPYLVNCNICTDDHGRDQESDVTFIGNNVFWTGSFRAPVVLADYTSYYNAGYVMFDLECPSVRGSNSAINAYVFANSEKCTSIGGTALTTEQMSDAQYLASVGFPIQLRRKAVM